MKLWYKFTLSIGIANATQTEIVPIDVDDDATTEEIMETVEMHYEVWCQNYIAGGFTEVEEPRARKAGAKCT